MLALSPLGRTDLGLSAVVSLAFAAYVFATYSGMVSSDLGSLYIAGRLVAAGQMDQVYWAGTGGMTPGWEAMLQASGVTVHTHTFLYPPLWPWVIAPVAAALSPEGFTALFLGLNTAAHLGTAVVAWRLFQTGPVWPWLGLSAALVPVTVIGASAFLFNQPQPILSLAVLLGLERAVTGHSRAAGALIALAASLKLYPVLFAAVFLIRRDWTGLTAFVVVGGALGVLSLIVGGLLAHVAFLELMFDLQGKISVAINNLSIKGFALSLAAVAEGRGAWEGAFQPGQLWVSAVQIGFLFGGLAALAWAGRGQDATWARCGFVPGVFILVSIATPLAWTHYFTPVLCLMAGLGAVLPRGAALALGGGVIAANSLFYFAEIAKPAEHPLAYTGVAIPSMLIFGMVMVLAARRRPVAAVA